MAKWKEIKEQRIQTFDKEIWLYDSANNISVKVPVPKRPWTKIDPDFTHWHKVNEGHRENPPVKNPDGKINLEMAEAMSTILGGFVLVADDEDEEDDELDFSF